MALLNKVKCNGTRCYWKGNERDLLTAPNPFEPTEMINGCPDCQAALLGLPRPEAGLGRLADIYVWTGHPGKSRLGKGS